MPKVRWVMSYESSSHCDCYRPANTKKFLSRSFQGKVAVLRWQGKGYPSQHNDQRPRQWAPSPPARGSMIFHCFGHFKNLSWIESVNSEWLKYHSAMESESSHCFRTRMRLWPASGGSVVRSAVNIFGCDNTCNEWWEKIMSDRYAKFWNYRYPISKKWHGR